MTRRISVRAVVVDNGKLLCVHLKPYKEALAGMADSGIWCTPGGGLDEGEALIPGLEREMFEETGIKPEVGSLLYIQQFAFNGKDFLEFFFHIANAEDYLHIDLTKTTHGSKEIEEIAFVDPAKTKILPKFLTTEALLNERMLTSTATKIFSYV